MVVCEPAVCSPVVAGAPLSHAFADSSTTFRGELVLLGNEQREGHSLSPCCCAFNLEANAWRSLAWEADGWLEVEAASACCATDTVVVVLSRAWIGGPMRLRSLRPGGVEGWVQLPDPPVDAMTSDSWYLPSLCCVEKAMYVAGGVDESGVVRDALHAFDFSTRA